jgi:hypothetical protein
MGMYDQSHRRSRRIAACLCLFAVVLFYAPLTIAALSGASCCANGICPVHKQHHDASNDAMPMDCGHDMSHMTPCSMSCCHTTDEAALNPQAFVIPQAATLSGPGLALESISPATSLELLLSSDPLSPPPRISSAAL